MAPKIPPALYPFHYCFASSLFSSGADSLFFVSTGVSRVSLCFRQAQTRFPRFRRAWACFRSVVIITYLKVVSDRASISTSVYRKNMQLQLWRPFVADVDLPIGVRTRIRTAASIMARRHEFADFLAYRELPYNGVAVGIFLRLLVEAGATLATRECYRWSIMITRPQRMS